LKKFFDASTPLLNPVDLVTAFTKKKPEQLNLPHRAIITFDSADVKRLLAAWKHSLIEPWTPFRWLYRIDGTDTLITKSLFGGPNVAALVEELSAFGVQEFVLWGYCGGIGEKARVGDTIIAKGALREDGLSYHYLDNEESKDNPQNFSGSDFVYSDWFDHWSSEAKAQGFYEGLIWSCDAIYRETRNKVANFSEMGISGVEMEVASFYAVCKFKGLKGIAFLVVSDSLENSTWTPGFHMQSFRQGVRKMADFMVTRVVSE
jgi:uridine phosphorylase